MTPEQMSFRNRAAAHAMHATHDSRATTSKAREAFNARFERQVDPDGLLEPEERYRRAEHARKAYFLSMALKSAKARKERNN